MYEYQPTWMHRLAAFVTQIRRSEEIAGISVWDATEEAIDRLRPHQRGHLRRAAKLVARAPGYGREQEIQAEVVARLCMASILAEDPSRAEELATVRALLGSRCRHIREEWDRIALIEAERARAPQ